MSLQTDQSQVSKTETEMLNKITDFKETLKHWVSLVRFSLNPYISFIWVQI